MVSPSSGDDYYASLGKNTTQAESGPEKKKIKIVAKKTVSTPTPVVTSTPTEKIAETTIPQEVIVEKIPEKEPIETPYVPRTIKLPESGQLNLGPKFQTRPGVVFHSHASRTVIGGTRDTRPSRPTTPVGNTISNNHSRPSGNNYGGSSSRPSGGGSSGGFR